MTHSPEIVFLEIFQDGGLYPSFTSTAVISSSRDHGDGLATFPGMTTVRIWERSKCSSFQRSVNNIKVILFHFFSFYFILFKKKKNQKLKTKGTSTSILKIVNEPVWDKHKRLRLCFCECLSGLFHKREETVLDKHKNFVALRMRMSPSNCAYHKAGASLCLSHKCEQLLLRASDRCAEGHATQNYSPMLETN